MLSSLKYRLALIVTLVVAAALMSAVVYGGTLGKIGKAIAYPVRKTAANASIDTHRAIGHNSVVHRKYGHYRRRNRVITPAGHVHHVH